MLYKGSELVFTSEIALYSTERWIPRAERSSGDIDNGAVNFENEGEHSFSLNKIARPVTEAFPVIASLCHLSRAVQHLM